MQLLTIGKLISTTDMATAHFLGQVLDVEDVLHGAMPRWWQQVDGVLEFTFGGEFYEFEEVPALVAA